MSTKDIKFSVGGRDYYIRQWPATKAIKMKLRIMKLLGGSLGELAKALKVSQHESGMDKDAHQIEGLTSAVTKLFENANEDQIVDLIVEVVEQATCDGERMGNKFDEKFSGEDMKYAYAVFAKIIMGNYQDFLKGLKLEGLLPKDETPAE